MAAITATKTPNKARQPRWMVIKLPKVGAISGDTAMTNINEEKTLAIWCTGNKSRTSVREATMPTHPPKA